jgi:carbon storage regulator
MLVLSRKTGERIVIDGSIVVTVLEAGSGRVRLGIDAPREYGISRPEQKRRSRPTRQPESREVMP